jgi:phenylacetate-CoA ligase
VIEVQGRSDDTLKLAAPGAKPVPVLPLALSTVLEDDAGLYDFQLDQLGASELSLGTPGQGADAWSALRRARTALQAFLARQGAPRVEIHCHAGRPNQRGPGGKVQRVRALHAPG